MKQVFIVILLTIFSIFSFTASFAGGKGFMSISSQLYSDTLHAVKYSIHLTEINTTAKTIKGYTEITATPLLNGITEVKFELINLTVDSVFTGTSRIFSYSYSSGRISIPLGNAAATGDTLKFTIYYHGQPFTDPTGWGGFHFAGSYAFNLGVGFGAIPHNLGKAWFPCIDDFHDRAQYDWYITVNNSLKAVCGGSLINVTDNGDNTSTWHWKTQYTLPTYLASVSIGNYVLRQDAYQGISGNVPITFYCRPGDTAKVNNSFLNLKPILSVFENHFGPYPFERVGYTATAQGAMEHAANISYPYAGWNGTTDYEWWYAHELSHMWFGNEVTCASAEDMWLNEGWARWCENLVIETLYGITAATNDNRSKLRDVLQNCHISDGGYYSLYGIPQTLTYGNTVYDKGGQVVHTLRHYLGDSLFFNGVKAYLQQYSYDYASSENLRDFLTQFTGVDMAPFFDAWVFSAGFPQFSVDSVNVLPAGSNFQATVYVRQKWKGPAGMANANHLPITFFGPQWQFYTDTLVFSGITGSKTFILPFSPLFAMADYYEQVSDATTDYAAVLKATGEKDFPETFAKVVVSKVTDSAFLRITHNWVAPDSLQLPRPGLRLSDYRHWKVEGNFPSGFKAQGKFSYNRGGNLDNTLITDSKDLLVLLYRKGAGFEWNEISVTRQGLWFMGNLIVDSLMPGEYSLAVWDDAYLQTGKTIRNRLLKISPNPIQDFFTIETQADAGSVLRVCDSTGRTIDEMRIESANQTFKKNYRDKSGNFLVFRLLSNRGVELESQKVIIR